MKNLIKGIISASVLLGALAQGAERGNEAEAVAMVQKTIAHLKQNGREKTFIEVNDPKGPFVDRDLYVVINDMNAKNLAHGGNHRILGKNLMDLKDIDGKYPMRERIAMIKASGKGWQDYKFVNQATQQIEKKSMYSERYEDLIVSCGVYKQ
ncbi:cache domain-containing protein [Rugamonas apoptosis]|uniref:Cache domain-containing protein n=1 Tax=Rugamonas apoptosis TaxID=2758570 RepID=A0A7W2FFB7_9BURK|nr:cache domain-containing protein [Rugamonas apoptosis]MBA5690650.1 cache domain-containing protein [Rugamonas apoptosis]